MGNGASTRVRRGLSYHHIKIWLLISGLVDYILFIKADVDIEPNLGEVQATRYTTADDLRKMFDDPKLVFTPWFKLICNSMLFEWWEHLDNGLEKYLNETQIRRM